LQDKLFDLEARMIQTTSETAKQTTKVNKLQEKVGSRGLVQRSTATVKVPCCMYVSLLEHMVRGSGSSTLSIH
jgi:hypothetical protein